MKRIVVQCESEWTKVALMNEGKLIDYAIEKQVQGSIVGNIYKGKIVNVLPGMEAAFVDIGLSKNAFLYIDDILPAHLEKHPKVKPSIDKLVKPGQEILVQVTKEPFGTKGAKVTTHYSLPGRWLVYMPEADYVGVSRKIASDEERERLRKFGETKREAGEGMILRTAAQGESEQSLERDLRELRKIWHKLISEASLAETPTELYRELDLLPRMLRDWMTSDVMEIVVNRQDAYDDLVRYAVAMKDRIHLMTTEDSIFDIYGVSSELKRLFTSKIWMDNGSYLNIDFTEALTVIDINTGKFTGTHDLEETVFDTNLAAVEIISQILRVRDIGGLIIIDFIDMRQQEHRDAVLNKMREMVAQDRTKTVVVGWTQLGLMEMTRKKVRQSQTETLYEQCPTCKGTGKIKKDIAY